MFISACPCQNGHVYLRPVVDRPDDRGGNGVDVHQIEQAERVVVPAERVTHVIMVANGQSTLAVIRRPDARQKALEPVLEEGLGLGHAPAPAELKVALGLAVGHRVVARVVVGVRKVELGDRDLNKEIVSPWPLQ